MYVRDNTFSNSVVDTWNNLPENVNAPSINGFKSRPNKQWHRDLLEFDATYCLTGQPTSSGIHTQYQQASIQV